MPDGPINPLYHFKDGKSNISNKQDPEICLGDLSSILVMI